MSEMATAPGASRGIFLEALRNALQQVLSQALSPDWKVQIGKEEAGTPASQPAVWVGLLLAPRASDIVHQPRS